MRRCDRDVCLGTLFGWGKSIGLGEQAGCVFILTERASRSHNQPASQDRIDRHSVVYNFPWWILRRQSSGGNNSTAPGHGPRHTASQNEPCHTSDQHPHPLLKLDHGASPRQQTRHWPSGAASSSPLTPESSPNSWHASAPWKHRTNTCMRLPCTNQPKVSCQIRSRSGQALV